jgi:hypothetical protein
MISRAAFKEIADAGGLVIFPARESFNDEISGNCFTVVDPLWWERKDDDLRYSPVTYTNDKEGWEQFLTERYMDEIAPRSYKQKLEIITVDR